MAVIVFHDMIQKNGKSLKESNLAKKYEYKLGTLVEMEEGVRMFVSGYRRDCDGSPLYCLSYSNDPWQWENNNCQLCGFGEDSLKEFKETTKND